MIESLQEKWVLATPPAAIIDNASLTVAEIDTKGWRRLDWFVLIGATDIALTALQATHSDSAGSGHANITGAAPGTLPGAGDDNTITQISIDLRGKKRYHDLTVTVGDGTAGAFVTVAARLSRPEEAPDTDAERGLFDLIQV